MSPKISIIIPVYNAGKYLLKCLNSVVAQTYSNLEIICVDDSSRDESLSIIKGIAQNDIRIKIIQKENEGVSLARNVGLKVATGEYVMFVDADDWIDKDTCKIALSAILQENADVMMWTYVSEHTNKSQKKEVFCKDKVVFEKQEVMELLHRRFIGLVGKELYEPEKADSLSTVWGKLYRRKLIADHGVLFPDIRKIGTYEDGMFNLLLFKFVDKAVYINRAMYHYRRTNQNSVTSNYNAKLAKQWYNLFDLMDYYIKSNLLSDSYQEALKNRIVFSVLGLGLNIMHSDLPVFEKVAELKNIIMERKYAQAVQNFELSYLPLKWKIFYGCAKHQNTLGLFLILSVLKRIIS